jgi:regulator of protease activity HflC (stomatin/prohibitin superfamily)
MQQYMKYIKPTVIGVISIPIILSSFFTVDSSEVMVIKRFGELHDNVYHEGLHFKAPLVDEPYSLDIRQQTFGSGVMSAATADTQEVSSNVAIIWKIKPSNAPEIYRNYRTIEEISSKVIAPIVSDLFKTEVNKFNSADLLKSRDTLRQKFTSSLVSQLSKYHIDVSQVSLTNFQFSKAYMDAIESKQQATVLRDKATIEQETAKIQAATKLIEAEGEANAIKVKTQAIQSNGGDQYIKYLAVTQWNGVAPLYVGGVASNGVGFIPFTIAPAK